MQRYAEMRRRAVEFVARHSSTPIAILAPSRAAADEVALAACGAASYGIRRFAVREFVLHLSTAEMNRRALAPVGRSVREALAARVTNEAMALGTLTYLRPVAGFPGFPRALTATFEELRLNAISPERLRDCGESGADLALLLTAYTRELDARSFADHAARVTLAREALDAPSSAVRRSALVALDLAPRTHLERELFAAALATARDALSLTLAPDDTEPATSLDSLQRFLFASEAVPVREEDGSVAIFSTSGEALECVELARSIHRAAAEGVPFDDIAILLRSPERHQPLILEALRRAAIPAHCTLAIRRPDVAGRSLLALLYCATEGLSASRFAEYLSLGQVPEEEEPAAPAQWERLLVDAAVIGGLDRWESRLAGLREEFHRRYDAEPDEAARDSLARRIAQVETLTRVALPIVARLAALPARATWGEWIAALAGLAEFAVRDAARIVELLAEWEPMAEIGPVSLGEVLLVLGPRLNALTAAPHESRFGKVWIGSIEEARGLAFRRVFVPGVNEGLFPRPPAEDPLLLETQRRALAIELRPGDTELLHIAAACATERLTLSFSRLDLLTGRERVPSFYAFAAHRAAGGRETGVREFEARARAATATRIGWPAPADPADAIDDAEFDLATLAPAAAGSGQYLKSLPGRSVHSLRARWARWHKSWKAADGLVIEELGNDALARHRLTARAWSPTALEQFARCPYRFALRGVFGLRPAVRPTGIQRMDPATRGAIHHAVLCELTKNLADTDALPVRADNLDAALARLDEVLPEIADQFARELAPAIPAIWRAETAAIRADLRGWLQQQAARESAWTSIHSEFPFGPVELDEGFQLQGTIDAIERHTSGALRVVDHKTGRVPDPRPECTGAGESLQPVLYALAAERALGEQVSAGRLAYSTLARNFATIDVPLNDWARHRAAAVLRAIDDALRDGFLPAAPRKDACRRCEYLPVCGPYEEERVAEKSQPELKSLKELRSWR